MICSAFVIDLGQLYLKEAAAGVVGGGEVVVSGVFSGFGSGSGSVCGSDSGSGSGTGGGDGGGVGGVGGAGEVGLGLEGLSHWSGLSGGNSVVGKRVFPDLVVMLMVSEEVVEVSRVMCVMTSSRET